MAEEERIVAETEEVGRSGGKDFAEGSCGGFVGGVGVAGRAANAAGLAGRQMRRRCPTVRISPPPLNFERFSGFSRFYGFCRSKALVASAEFYFSEIFAAQNVASIFCRQAGAAAVCRVFPPVPYARARHRIELNRRCPGQIYASIGHYPKQIYSHARALPQVNLPSD